MALRIAQSAQAHGLAEISVVLHGGEPLLAGQAHRIRGVELPRNSFGPDISASLSIQTNGVLLTPESSIFCSGTTSALA